MCTLVHTSFLDCLCVSASSRLRLFYKAFSFPVIFFIDGRLAHVIQSNTEDHAMKTAIGGPSNTTAPAVIGFSERQAGTRGEEILQREQSVISRKAQSDIRTFNLIFHNFFLVCSTQATMKKAALVLAVGRDSPITATLAI